MGRTVGGFFAGFLTAMIVVILCQNLNFVLYPLPEGLDPQDTEALAAHIANSPTGALVGVLASYFFGSFAGGAVAARIGRDPRVGLEGEHGPVDPVGAGRLADRRLEGRHQVLHAAVPVREEGHHRDHLEQAQDVRVEKGKVLLPS